MITISVIEMISFYRDYIGSEEFERIALDDFSKIDAYAQSLGYQYDEEINAYVKSK